MSGFLNVFKGSRTSGLFIGIAVVLLTLSFLAVPPGNHCEANSAAPPSITIVVTNAPDDLEIYLVELDSRFGRTDRAFESYFTIYSAGLRSGNYTLRVTSEEKSFDSTIKVAARFHENTWALDLDKGELSEGLPGSRTFFLVSIRLLATLALEGLVFLGFRYRKKRSWIVFLAVNLLTQGALNIWIDFSSSPLDSYVILGLFFWEILIIIVEMVVFSIFVDEKSRWLTNLYVLIANILSLVAGGYFITVLPI